MGHAGVRGSARAHLDDSLQHLARGGALVGRLVERHAMHDDAAEAVRVRSPVRVHAEAAAVDGGGAHERLLVEVEVLADAGELVPGGLRGRG